MKIAVLGRTHWLSDAAARLLDAGHELTLVATAPAAPEYRAVEEDFRALAARAGASFALDEIPETDAELAVSVNWPQVLGRDVIDRFPRGIVNAHAGDLPRYRGNAAPNWAIINGEQEVVLTLHLMDEGLDSGPVLAKWRFPLGARTTIGDVYAWLDATIPAAFLEVVDGLAAGTIEPRPQPQDPALALRVPRRRPEDSELRWGSRATELDRVVRPARSRSPARSPTSTASASRCGGRSPKAPGRARRSARSSSRVSTASPSPPPTGCSSSRRSSSAGAAAPRSRSCATPVGDSAVLDDLLARAPDRVVDGIPRFVHDYDEGQSQVQDSFAYKWERRETYDSDHRREIAAQWILERYGFASVEELPSTSAAESPVLDVGCGGGFSAGTWLAPGWGGRYVGADISNAVDVASERLGHVETRTSCRPTCSSCRSAPRPSTRSWPRACCTTRRRRRRHSGARAAPSPRRRVARLRLPPKGAAPRVHRRLRPRPHRGTRRPSRPGRSSRPLTRLAQALAELDAEVDVPEDVPLLGISAGRHDVQRLIYWHFAKLFWNRSCRSRRTTTSTSTGTTRATRTATPRTRCARWCDDVGVEITLRRAGERLHRSREEGLTVCGIAGICNRAASRSTSGCCVR